MLGELIKKYLNENGIKHTYVAEELGIKKNLFSAMLSGKRKITAEEYFKICIVLKLNPAYFAEKVKNAS